MNLTYWLASLTRDLFHCCSPPGAVCDSQQSSNNIYPPAMQIIMTHAYPSWTLCFFGSFPFLDLYVLNIEPANLLS